MRADHDREVGPALGESVSVVIPTINEEGSIDWVLQHIPEWVSEVVLVDGLSTDRTELVARRLRPDLVVVHQRQRGKGAALRAGFAAARGDIIVMLDADGSTDPREMGRFVAQLEAGADFVKGSRHLADGGSADFTRLRRLGNRALVGLANVLYGARFTDLCYGYCAFWRRHVLALELSADGFEIETQLVLHALRAGLEIREVPSLELERRAGSSKLDVLGDGRRVLRTMINTRTRRSTAAAARPRVVAVEVPDHESEAWWPAGRDRRRADRRVRSASESGYLGTERRRGSRRRAPRSTSPVYLVVDAEGGPAGTR